MQSLKELLSEEQVDRLSICFARNKVREKDIQEWIDKLVEKITFFARTGYAKDEKAVIEVSLSTLIAEVNGYYDMVRRLK